MSIEKKKKKAAKTDKTRGEANTRMHSPSPTTEAGNLPPEQDLFCVQPEDNIPDAVIANKNGADEIEVDYEPEEEAVQVPAKERSHKGFIDGPHTYLGQRCTGRYPPLDYSRYTSKRLELFSTLI